MTVGFAVAGVIALGGCGSTNKSEPIPEDSPTSTSAESLSSSDPTAEQSVSPIPTTGGTGTAAAALAALQVKGRAPKTGYSREQFGQTWADVNRNGCDTRTDILIRDLVNIQSSGRCTITAGTLNDPYTSTTIRYVRGGRSEVDIDHVVALSNAWQTGAFAFPFAKRVALANDPLNLLAVDSSANRQKGDGDAATWLPPTKSYRCAYVARQIEVKTKYQLWVTAPEADAMNRILKFCPGQRLPTPGPQPTEANNPGSIPEPAKPPSAATRVPGSASGSSQYYRTCVDARAAGVTPILAGTPAYSANEHLDRDKDGVACE